MSLSATTSKPGYAGEVLIQDASWRLYESFLKEIEETGGKTRLTYSNGRLEIRSPLPEHEDGKSLLAQLERPAIQAFAAKLRWVRFRHLPATAAR